MVISARVASSSHTPLWPFPHARGPIPLTLENGGVISVVHEEGGDDSTEKAPPLDPWGGSGEPLHRGHVHLSVYTHHLQNVRIPHLVDIDSGAPARTILAIALQKREVSELIKSFLYQN